MSDRPSWDEYFLDQVTAIAKRATCDRGRSGCVITRDNQVLATGYVGSPPGFAHCDEAGHLFENSYSFTAGYSHSGSFVAPVEGVSVGVAYGGGGSGGGGSGSSSGKGGSGSSNSGTGGGGGGGSAIIQHCIRTVHAEQNAICSAAKRGVALDGCTVYCTMEPCRICAYMIISVGAERVVAWKMYQSAGYTRTAFKWAGVQLDVIGGMAEYE